MGGYAFIIEGNIDESKEECFEKKTSIWDKIVGKESIKKPKVIQQGNEQFIELDAKVIEKELSRKFINFMKNLDKPWQATTAIINNYLSVDVLSIYLRGYENTKERKKTWCIQFSFSGCGGMAEISARVLSHFIEIWYKLHKNEIDRVFFTKLGFSSCYEESLDSCFCFPLGESGYIVYQENTFYSNNEEEIFCHFDIDEAIIENIMLRNLDKALILKIDSLITSYFKQELKCYCQLCFPDFVPPQIHF